MDQFPTSLNMRTSVVAPREVFDKLLEPTKGKRLSVSKPRSSPPHLLPLLLCVPLLLTLWTLSAEIILVNRDFTTISHVQHLLNAAEDASPVLESFNESLIENATYYPEDLFKVDWSRYIKTSDILHQNALHRGCMTYKDSIIPPSFGRRGQNAVQEREEVVDRRDPMLLDKIRKCPDVDILLPDHLRNFGYCEDGAAYSKFLGARMLPRWVLDVKFEDPVHKRSVSYHDLCPNTPMLFFNHYWERVPDSSDWPATKPLYLMPNIEMYELDESHYWRADVILCKTALCARYLRKWFLQEGNPRGTRVVYTRHTTTNLALASNQLNPRKNFSDVAFLHTAGKSIQKGTRQVLDCWLDRPEFPRLDFYMDKKLYESDFSDYEERISDSSNIYLHTGGLSVSGFSRILTQGRYFLCPSVMEGYGHYINQARSARAFIFTTDVAPMNELITPSSGALIRARTGAYGEQFLGGTSTKEHALQDVPGLVAGFENGAVCEAVRDFLENTTPEERAVRADKALQQYYFDTVFFAHRMNDLRTFARAMSHPSLRGKILKTSYMQ